MDRPTGYRVMHVAASAALTTGLLVVTVAATALMLGHSRSSPTGSGRQSGRGHSVAAPLPTPPPAAVALPAPLLPVTLVLVRSTAQAATIEQEFSAAASLLATAGTVAPPIILVVLPATLAVPEVAATDQQAPQVVDLRPVQP